MKSVPPTQKFNSRKEWGNYVWQKIVGGLAEAADSKGIEKSLDILLTASEKKQIINRAAAVSMLREGKTYKEIAEMLWLSPTTISAIKKSILFGGEYESRYMRRKTGKDAKKPNVKKDSLRFQIKFLIDALFEVPPPPRQGRRIPPGRFRVVQPHGKLARHIKVRRY